MISIRCCYLVSRLRRKCQKENKLFEQIHWGSEIQPFKVWKHLKSGHFEDKISSGPVFKGSSYTFSFSSSPYHSKTRPLQTRHFCPYFKWVLTKWRHFLGFQMVSDPIWNPHHLQINLFLMTIQSLFSGIQVPTILQQSTKCLILNLNQQKLINKYKFKYFKYSCHNTKSIGLIIILANKKYYSGDLLVRYSNGGKLSDHQTVRYSNAT